MYIKPEFRQQLPQHGQQQPQIKTTTPKDTTPQTDNNDIDHGGHNNDNDIDNTTATTATTSKTKLK